MLVPDSLFLLVSVDNSDGDNDDQDGETDTTY